MSNDFKKLEINILLENDFLHTELIDYKNKRFDYKGKKYNIKSKCVYLIPCKNGFMPTSFYLENKSNPLRFIDKNKSITARALHLLWNPILYQELVTMTGDRTNLIIILVLLAGFIFQGIKLYLTYGG